MTKASLVGAGIPKIPVIPPPVTVEKLVPTSTPATLTAPDAGFVGLPASAVALATTPGELSKVLDVASKAARTSAANLTSLVAHLTSDTGRVRFDAALVDTSKLGFGQGSPNRDASFAKASPTLLKDIGDVTSQLLHDRLGIQSIRQLARTAPAELDVLLAEPGSGEKGVSPAQLERIKAVHAKLQAYEDTKPTVDLPAVSAVRARLEGTEKTVSTMAGLLGTHAVELSDALVRLNATFQWLDQANTALGNMSDEELARRVKGSPQVARAEVGRIRELVDAIGARKEAFIDAKTATPEQLTHKKDVADSTTALLTQPLGASSPFAVKQVPNLSPKERIIEKEFLDAFSLKGGRMVREFLKNVRSGMYGPPNVIAPDDAKLLSPRYARADVFAGKPVTQLDDLDPDSKRKVQQSRAEANIPLHMTATVIARLALVQALDDLAKDPSVPADQKTLLVTCGGVAAGKGYAVKHASDKLGDVAKTAKLVYDTDGETSGTFNEFVMQACKERGIHPIFLYVHADASTAWERVFSRAAKEGRMVSEEPFLDSHVDSPRNFAAFHRAHAADTTADGKAAATFVIIDNATGTPKLVDQVPADALAQDRDALRHVIKQKTNLIEQVPEFVIKTAKRGERLWPERYGGG